MYKTQSMLFITLIIIGFASAAQNVNFTCETVDKATCASGFRYRTIGNYESNVLNSTYCIPSGSSCAAQTNYFNIQSCKIDYKNAACSTGVCFMYPSKPICTLDATCGTVDNPKTYTANYSCDNCNDGSTCVKCLTTSSTQFNVSGTTTTACLGGNCTQGIATTRSTVARCPNGIDGLGQTCTCCVTTIEVARFCTSNSPALSQAQVTNWFNKVEGNTQFQLKSSAILLTILLAILAIIY